MTQLKATLYSSAVVAEIPSFVDDALAKFKKYTEGDDSAINPNLRGAVFRTAAKKGGKAAFDKLLETYQTKPAAEGLAAINPLVSLLMLTFVSRL